jgi:hypothetical protein
VIKSSGYNMVRRFFPVFALPDSAHHVGKMAAGRIWGVS